MATHNREAVPMQPTRLRCPFCGTLWNHTARYHRDRVLLGFAASALAAVLVSNVGSVVIRHLLNEQVCDLIQLAT